MFDFYKWLNSPLGESFNMTPTQKPEMGQVSYAEAPNGLFSALLPSLGIFGASAADPKGAETTAGLGLAGLALLEGGGVAGGTTSGGSILDALGNSLGGMFMSPKDTTLSMPSNDHTKYAPQVSFANAPTSADVAQAKTGIIPEPVVGKGQITGKTYSFAEYAPEQVTKPAESVPYFDNKVSAYDQDQWKVGAKRPDGDLRTVLENIFHANEQEKPTPAITAKISFANAPSESTKADASKIIMDGVLANLEEKTKEMSGAIKTMKNFKEDPGSVSSNDIKEAIDSIAHGLEGSPMSPAQMGPGHKFASKESVFPNMGNPFNESMASLPPEEGQVSFANAPEYGTPGNQNLGAAVNSVVGDVKSSGLDNWASNLGALAIEGIKTYVDLSLAAGGSNPYFSTMDQKEKDRQAELKRDQLKASTESPWQFVTKGDEIIPVNKFTSQAGEPIATTMSDESAFKLVQKEITDATGEKKTELGKRLLKTSYAPDYKILRAEELKNPKLTAVKFIDGGKGGQKDDELQIYVEDPRNNVKAWVPISTYNKFKNTYRRV